MIVKNEEAALPKCLSSAKNVVDEIVVLDTGSTDNTVQIAKQYGAEVHYFEWCNNFSVARNEALKYVTTDWILVLDADETLAPEIAPSMKAAIQNEEYLLINLVRQEVGAAQSPYSMVSRLFRRHPNIYFNRPYHAIIDDSVTAILEKESHWQIAYLSDVAILHYGYQKAIINQQNKYAKAAAAMEVFFVANPQDPYVCSKLGALYVEMGKVNQGMDLLQRGIKYAADNYDILYELHYHLGIAHSHLKDFSQAISHYQAAVKLPILPILKLGAYNNLGNLLKATGDLTGAKIAYETTLKIDPSFVTGYYNVGMTFKAMGLYLEAIAAYDQAIQLNPDYAEAYQNLGVVLLKVGEVQASIAAFENAIALHEPHNPLEAQRLRQGLQEMGLLPS
jgi:glycosyltransferase involved in cell wall biosynthesis